MVKPDQSDNVVSLELKVSKVTVVTSELKDNLDYRVHLDQMVTKDNGVIAERADYREKLDNLELVDPGDKLVDPDLWDLPDPTDKLDRRENGDNLDSEEKPGLKVRQQCDIFSILCQKTCLIARSVLICVPSHIVFLHSFP